MKKSRHASEAEKLEQIPNIGPAVAQGLREIGVRSPADLRNASACALYARLNEKRGYREDPCVLDTFMAAIDFMNGAAPKPWWHYTSIRKKLSDG
jgi:hypothetical protein